jgi:hypothetical protein
VSRNFITFRSTWAHPIFLVGFFSFLCNVLYIRLSFFSFDPCVVCPKIYGLELTVPFGIYTLFFLIKNILSICCNRVLNHSRLSVVNIWLPLLGGPLRGGGIMDFCFPLWYLKALSVCALWIYRIPLLNMLHRKWRRWISKFNRFEVSKIHINSVCSGNVGRLFSRLYHYHLS